MPRITPGITSGASISSDSADLPRNCARSSRNAFAVPTTTDSSVTHSATMTLVPTLRSSGCVGEESGAAVRRRRTSPA